MSNDTTPLSLLLEWAHRLGAMSEDALGAAQGCQTRLLTESQESKSIAKAKKLVIDKFGWDEQRADKFVRKDLRQDIPTLRGKTAAKFLEGVARMYCEKQLEDKNTKLQLDKVLKYVASDAHINEYDRNLNGMTAQALIERFAANVEADLEADRQAVSAQEYANQANYKIIPINSFEEAKAYGQYTSWCVTQDKAALDGYSSGGIKQFYFCLREGFETVEKVKGEGCPLDEYGLSMVAVCVDDRGALSTCTCRWNHSNGGNDHIMSTEQISRLVGRNFYDVFKPNNMWQETVEKAMRRLAAGEDLKDAFDWCGDFHDGYARVELSGKCNWVGTDGQLLSPKQWFDKCAIFSGGYAVVVSNDKWNWIGTDGQLLSPDQWFDECRGFHDGYARVELKGKWNFIGTDGNLLFPDQWFTYCSDFRDGYAVVELNGKRNWIDTDGNLLFPDQWFDDVDGFYNGYAAIELKGQWNWTDTDGQLLFPNQWFDKCCNFCDGYAMVKLKGKWNFIGTDGKFLSPDQWFDGVDGFYKGYARVKLKGKWNFIGTDGKFLSPKRWFDWCNIFHEGYAVVELNGQLYNIDADGNLYDKRSKEFIRNMKTGERPNANESLDRIVRESISRVLRMR